MGSKTYDEGFKKHMVELYESGQKQADLAREYDVNKGTLSGWIQMYKRSGSFKAKDNVTAEQKKIKELEKQVLHQQMEIDILKKAMVVMLKN